MKRLCLPALVLSLCGSAAVADEALEQNKSRWLAAGIDHYTYAYQKFCDCHRDEPPQTFVEVQADEVIEVFHLHDDSDRRVPAREGSLALYWTITDLFQLVETAEARGVSYRVSYDAATGRPTQVYIDYDPAAVGEEIDVRLTAFQAHD